MVDHPDPRDAGDFDPDAGGDGMPARTRRAFQAHADQQLRDKPARAVAEIERVYRRDPGAVVSVSGGKDSMVALALAARADCDHRALHWDYGPEFVPRETARRFVDAILSYVDPARLYVANEAMDRFLPHDEAATFRAQLRTDDRLSDRPSLRGTDEKLVQRLAPRLRRTVEAGTVGRQILGLRRAESGSRARKIDGLYGWSLGNPAAFPLREWSARDVWGYIVATDVPYPDHYDSLAGVIDDGSPAGYEQARMSAFFRDMGNPGRLQQDVLAAWRDFDIAFGDHD